LPDPLGSNHGRKICGLIDRVGSEKGNIGIHIIGFYGSKGAPDNIGIGHGLSPIWYGMMGTSAASIGSTRASASPSLRQAPKPCGNAILPCFGIP
jgi:hypothetical protein